MATPIVIHPQDKSPIVIKGGDKGSAIRVDQSINWNKVEGIVADAVAGAVKEMAVDDHLSAVSTNAVQNKVVTAEIEALKSENEQLKNKIAEQQLQIYAAL